jgi:hypothetical protein
MARATTPSTRGARAYVIVSFVFAAIAIVFFPILFGPAAIILAVIGHRKGDHIGRVAIVVSVVCTALGLFLGYLATPTYMG